ncbi:MAG: ATP-binding protein [Microvirga sp.]
MSLSGQFLLTAFAVMLVGMLALGTWVSWQIEKSVSDFKAASAALTVSSFITPHLQELAFRKTLSEKTISDLDRDMERPDLRTNILSLRVWRRDGVIVYSSAQTLVGERLEQAPASQAVWAGTISVQFEDPSQKAHIDQRDAGHAHFKVFAPIRESETGKIIAAVEFHERAQALEAELVAAEWQTWIATILITLNMMGALFVIVANGSKTIDHQRAALSMRVAQLSGLLKQNRVLHERIERAAQNATESNERFLRQMGYDLHDGVAQLVSLALLRLSKVHGSPQDHDNLGRTQKALSDALTDIRNICKGLLLPEVEKLSLREALTFMIRLHERTTGTSIICNIAELPGQAPQFVKIALCRFVQEGLNNAFKHAGGQGQKVDITWDGISIDIEVSDKGPGMCDPDGQMKQPGFGLAGLRDRIESIGGTVNMRSGPEAGTCIKASLPLTMGVADAA